MLNRCRFAWLVLLFCPGMAYAGASDSAGGLRLELTLAKTTFHQGEPIAAIVQAENLGATKPVAASFCANFGFSYEDIAGRKAVFQEVSPPACGGDPYHDNMRPLRPGHPLVLTLKDIGLDMKPGRYLVMSSWDSSVVGEETAIFGPRYAPVGSNVIAVTILP